MPTEATIRKRRNRHDAYYDDDVVQDGEIVRTRMTMADSAMRDVIHQMHPPRIAYKRGYCTDVNSGLIVDARAPRSPFQVAQGSVPTQTAKDLPRGESFPTQSGGTWPSYNNQIGAKCTCENGRPGTLQPHPSTSSMLICVETNRDAATVDATSLYYQLRDDLPNEYKRHQAKPVHDCGCHKDQQGTNIGHINQQLPWSTGQGTGNSCTLNGAPGHYERREDGQLVCVPDRRDQAASNIGPPSARVGFEWAQGGECRCPDGSDGLYVRQGDMLICKPRADFDHRSVGDRSASDRAYHEMVEQLRDAWRSW
jgi:hypothetical protein